MATGIVQEQQQPAAQQHGNHQCAANQPPGKGIHGRIHGEPDLPADPEDRDDDPAEKGDDAHSAAVVGDTIGDPFKDTSGPSLNILIKLMSIVSVVIAGLIA